MVATHVTFRVYFQVGVVWLYQGETLRNKTLACTMFMPLQRAFLAVLMSLIPVKESFCRTCSGRYVAYFTAKTMFTVSYLATGISLIAVQNMTLHILRFMSFPSSPVFLIYLAQWIEKCVQSSQCFNSRSSPYGIISGSFQPLRLFFTATELFRYCLSLI